MWPATRAGGSRAGPWQMGRWADDRRHFPNVWGLEHVWVYGFLGHFLDTVIFLDMFLDIFLDVYGFWIIFPHFLWTMNDDVRFLEVHQLEKKVKSEDLGDHRWFSLVLVWTIQFFGGTQFWHTHTPTFVWGQYPLLILGDVFVNAFWVLIESWLSRGEVARWAMAASCCIHIIPYFLWVTVGEPVEATEFPNHMIDYWLVVWNMNFMFPFSWEFHTPNWQRGWSTTNQIIIDYLYFW